MPSEADFKSVRCLVLGCGSIGRRHVENLLRLGVQQILVFDTQASRSISLSEKLGILSAKSLDQVWDWKPTVVFVATSTGDHISLALQAAQSNCHIFIEKPLSHTLEGVDTLISETDRRNLTTMVGCNMRFHPGPAKIKELLDRERIGRVLCARLKTGSYLPRWRPHEDFRNSYSASEERGGATLDCIHELDLALWFFGSGRVLSGVTMKADSIGLATDGLSESLMLHEKGVISSVHLNFIQRDYHRECQIIGSEGSIYWDYSDKSVKVFGANGKLDEIFSEPEGWEINSMYVEEIRSFLFALQERAQSTNPVRQGKKTLELALVIRSSESVTNESGK